MLVLENLKRGGAEMDFSAAEAGLMQTRPAKSFELSFGKAVRGGDEEKCEWGKAN